MRDTIRPASLIKDVEGAELRPEAVTDARNMVPNDVGFSQARPTAEALGAFLYQPRLLQPNQTPSVAYWLYASDENVGVTDGSTHWNVTPAGLTDASDVTSPWVGDLVNQIPVLNSRVDGPFWWDQVTGNIMTALPDWPAGDLCQSMRSFRGFLIAMNVFESGVRKQDLVKWSGVAAPGDIPRVWTPADNNQAGAASVNFNPGGLVDGGALHDRFYMYKTGSTFMLQLIGGEFTFDNQPVFKTVGLLSRNCLAEYRGRHIVLTDGDLVAHDGVNVESLIDAKNRKEVFANLDGQYAFNSFIVLQPESNELWVCRPRTGEQFPHEAYVLDLNTGRWGHRDLPGADGAPHAIDGLVGVGSSSFEQTWADRTTQWSNDPTRWNSGAFLRTANYVVTADYAASKAHQLGVGNDLSGQAIVTSLEREGLVFGDSSRAKTFQRMWPRITGPIGATVQLEVGAAETSEGTVNWKGPITFTIGTTKWLDLDELEVEGCYLAYRFSSTSQLTWKLSSFQVEWEYAGE